MSFNSTIKRTRSSYPPHICVTFQCNKNSNFIFLKHDSEKFHLNSSLSQKWAFSGTQISKSSIDEKKIYPIKATDRQKITVLGEFIPWDTINWTNQFNALKQILSLMLITLICKFIRSLHVEIVLRLFEREQLELIRSNIHSST